jgi:hypothetical protein
MSSYSFPNSMDEKCLRNVVPVVVPIYSLGPRIRPAEELRRDAQEHATRRQMRDEGR